MLAATVDENYERIRGDLMSLGLTYDRLLDDMVDHVCCMVEEQMCGGDDFETSYSLVLGSIPEKQLPLIQHQTLLNLDKKYKRMKKFTYVFGLISALIVIVGSVFKSLHWPGSGISLTVGILMIVLGFLPLYFTTSYREQPEKKNPLYAIVGYITLALLLLGALFKVMHWPGANITIYASFGFLIVGFMPLYVVNVFQKAGKERVLLPYVVMILVGIAILMLFQNVRMSRYYLELYRKEAVANEERVKGIREKTLNLIDKVKESTDSNQIQTIEKIHDQARDLLAKFQTFQNELKAYTGQPGVPTGEIVHMDNLRASRNVIGNNDMGYNLMMQCRSYRDMLYELVTDPVTRSQIEDHLEFTGDIWELEFSGYGVNNTLIKNIYKSSDAMKGIALSEYVAIAWLMHQQ